MAGKSEKSKRNVLSLGDRLKIIDHVKVNPHKSKRLTAEEFNVPYSTLVNIIQNKKKYREQAATGQTTSARKRARASQLDAVDKALLERFTSCSYDFCEMCTCRSIRCCCCFLRCVLGWEHGGEGRGGRGWDGQDVPWFGQRMEREAEREGGGGGIEDREEWET